MLIQKIERVNSMTIRKMANEELSQCVDVIRKSYETEAVAFGITEMNCPQHAAFITLDRLQMSAEWGYVFYGAFEDDELIACFAIENKDDRFMNCTCSRCFPTSDMAVSEQSALNLPKTRYSRWAVRYLMPVRYIRV